MNGSYIFKSPIGTLAIHEKDGFLTRAYLVQEQNILLADRFTYHSDLLFEAYSQINEYFSQKRIKFNIPISVEGTEFQKRVWQELCRIPYGETKSYKDIAVEIGDPKAARAVGQANNKNPIFIIIPCHRVIRKNGSIDGFTYGTEIKKYLLNLENSIKNPH